MSFDTTDDNEVAGPPPKVKAPPSRKPRDVKQTKGQEDFQGDAESVAASLGWEGPADNVLRGIRVADAITTLRRVRHLAHQAARNEHVATPDADSLARDLNLGDGAKSTTFRVWLAEAIEDEEEEAAAAEG